MTEIIDAEPEMKLRNLGLHQEPVHKKWILAIVGFHKEEKGVQKFTLGEGECAFPVLMSKTTLIVAMLERGMTVDQVNQMLKKSDEYLKAQEPKSIIHQA